MTTTTTGAAQTRRPSAKAIVDHTIRLKDEIAEHPERFTAATRCAPLGPGTGVRDHASMAQHTKVIVTDDLDRSEPAQNYRFSWQGTEYEIDLNDVHRDEFLRALAPYVDAGRRVGGRRRTATSSSSRGVNDSAAVREWARANGYRVTDRGRIPGEIRTAYDNR